MLVIRKGKIREVKKIQKGDFYIDKCFYCKGPAVAELLNNDHTKYRAILDPDGMFDDRKELEIFLINQKIIAEKEKENGKEKMPGDT